MIGKIIAGIAGAKVAENTRGGSGAAGALLGIGIATLLRRMSPFTIVAAAVGSYALKRYVEKHETKGAAKPAPPAS